MWHATCTSLSNSSCKQNDHKMHVSQTGVTYCSHLTFANSMFQMKPTAIMRSEILSNQIISQIFTALITSNFPNNVSAIRARLMKQRNINAEFTITYPKRRCFWQKKVSFPHSFYSWITSFCKCSVAHTKLPSFTRYTGGNCKMVQLVH